MHSAIFVAEINPEYESDWKNFLEFVALKNKSARSIARLSENVWLVNFLVSPAALGWLIAGAEQRGVFYRILQLDAAPQWLPADPNSTSN
jgi:hypothetical protein